MSPLGTAATNRSIVPAPGEYDDGEIGGMRHLSYDNQEDSCHV
jgi:hypothetical protein